MPPEIRGSSQTSDELRLKNYRAVLERKNEIEVQDLNARHTDEMERISENQALQLESLRNAYDVKISSEAEILEDRLHQIRMTNEERIASEKRAGQDELNHIKSSHQARVEEYRKNSEAQIDELHRQLQNTSEVLHEQAKKTAKRERENK